MLICVQPNETTRTNSSLITYALYASSFYLFIFFLFFFYHITKYSNESIQVSGTVFEGDLITLID